MAGAGMIAPSLLSNPMSALSLAAFSPRIVGETVHFGGRVIGTVDDVAARLGITPANLRALERGSYQAGHNDETAKRGLELYRQREAAPGNPYMMQGAF